MYLGSFVQAPIRIDLDNPRGAIRDFIAQEPVQREIAARFKNMLRTFTDASGDLVYKDRLRDMCTSEPSCACQGYPGARLTALAGNNSLHRQEMVTKCRL